MLSKEEKLNLRLDYGVGKHSNAFTVQLARSVLGIPLQPYDADQYQAHINNW